MRKNEIVMSFGFCVIGGLEFEWMPKMQARTAPKGQTSNIWDNIVSRTDSKKNVQGGKLLWVLKIQVI